MESIKLTIDGQEVEASLGETILQAAARIGVEIPTFCQDEELSCPGSCRICVVEVKGARNMPASCVTAIQPGMVVETRSEAVVEARRTILELLLADHPNDCLTCEAAGRCTLQRYAYEYGVRFPEVRGKVRQHPVDEANPFILRDMNKCILCGKCVRVCDEIQGRQVLDYAYRGVETKIVAAGDLPLNQSSCVYCGSCVSVCPTGALTDKAKQGLARPWETKKVRTTCSYCGTGCNFDLEVKEGAIIGVSSSPDSPVNGRALCVKGRYGYHFIQHPDRLKTPLIRGEEGEFREASWEEALSLVAEKLKAVKQTHGGEAIGLLSSARCTNEENYLMMKLARGVLGTNHIDHCARLCHATTVTGLRATLGSGAMTNPIADIEKADFLLVIGSNTSESHPIISLAMGRAVKKGATLAVIDPRRIEMARKAHYHLQLKPGSDLALLNSLAYVILEEGLQNQPFIEERCENFVELEETVRDYSPEKTAPITGLDPEGVRAVARAYATAKNGAIFYTMGITQKTTGTHNVMAIANLAMLTGHIGRPGTGVNPLRGQNNVQGACDMGALPNYFTGYQLVEDSVARSKFESAWGVPLPMKNGYTVGEMFEAAHRERLKAMYIMGENPLLSDPNASHVEESLKALDFLVVQDIFLTETARLAHVVLPAASFAEKDGVFANTERRVQRVRKAVEPPGEAKADLEILQEVARALGADWVPQTAAEVQDEIAALTPSYGGISHQRLEGESLCWPCPDPSHPGTPILHGTAFTRGKGRFQGVHYLPPHEIPDEDYPLILSTGRRLFHYHTGTMSRKNPGIDFIYPEEHLEIHPDDASDWGVADDDWLKVTTRRGSIRLRARLTKNITPGMVFTSFHFAEANVNRLTNDAYDSQARTPEMKVCAVRVEKTETPFGYKRRGEKRFLV